MRSLAACAILLLASVASADSKDDRAGIDVRNLSKVVQADPKAKGNPPGKLKDLIAAGYVDPKATLLDPWGNPYRSDANGQRNGGKRPDIWTVNPDKKLIGNWLEEKK
jgi:hypothetical protein